MCMRKTGLKALLASGSALSLLMAAGVAAAQQAAKDDTLLLEELVVTANKRVETVQTVAASVSVLNGANLVARKQESLTDYLAYVPGVTPNSSGGAGQTSVTIRGIAPLSSGSKVATYVDETPLGASGIWARSARFSLDLLPFDLERLEILRGPQGTLYGASSMGGLLKYVFKTPDTNNFTVQAAADLGAIKGAHDLAQTYQARVNVPIKEDVAAVSVSAYYKETPGYIDNAYNGDRDINKAQQYGGRVGLFVRPAQDLTVKLNAMWETIDQDSNAVISTRNPAKTRQADGSFLISGGTSLGDLTTYKAFNEPFKKTIDFYSATLQWTPGDLEVTSATSYSKARLHQILDQSNSTGSQLALFGLPAGLAYFKLGLGLEKFTQELRIASPQEGRFSWMAGVFYTDEDATNTQQITALTKVYQPIPQLQPYAGLVSIPTSYKEYAAFGNATLKITDKFDVSAGIRYSENKQDYGTTAQGPFYGAPLTPPTVLPNVKSKEDNTTWMADARYRFTQDVMTYVRVAKGYAPGGANTPKPGVPTPTVGSETLTSYEAGIKSQFLERRAMVNLSFFQIDWNDIQLSALVPNGSISYFLNGGKAQSKGFELASSYSPISGLTLGFNAGHTLAELKTASKSVATPYVLGKQLAYVPKWSASTTIDYKHDLMAGWVGNVGAGVRWVDRSSIGFAAVGASTVALPSHTVVDANASMTKDRLTFRVYARNLLDDRSWEQGTFDNNAQGVPVQLNLPIIQPRLLGVGVVAAF